MRGLKKGSLELKLLKTLGKFYDGTDLSNIFSKEAQASPLAAGKVSLDDLVKKIGVGEKRIRRVMDNVEEYWELPGDVPCGIFSQDEARIRRLARQERLRRIEGDGKDNGNYKEDKIHIFCSELGLGATYGNSDIFKGFALFIEAQNYAPKLKSFIMQGGGMPENPAMWSKLNHERMKQVARSELAKKRGVLKKEITTKEIEEELGQIRRAMESPEFTKEDREHIKKYIIDTPTTLEQLSVEGAYWLAPTFDVLNKNTAIFYQYSMADYYNMNQSLELFIVGEKIRKAQEEEIAKLDDLEEEHIHRVKERAIYEMYESLGNYVIKRLEQTKKRQKEGKEKLGSELQDFVKNNIYNGTAFQRKKAKIKKKLLEEIGLKRFIRFNTRWEKDKEKRKEKKKGKEKGKSFDEYFNDAMLEFYANIKSLYEAERVKDIRTEKIEQTDEKIFGLEGKISKLNELKLKLKEETSARMWWLTKKRTINNLQAKMTAYLVKKRYNKHYQDMFFKHLPKFVGKKFKNLRILSSLETTLAEETMPGQGKYRSGKLFDPGVSPHEATHYVDIGGMTIALFPNPDFQRSSDPKEGDSRRIQLYFNEALAETVAKHLSAGEIKKDKYSKLRLCTADIIFTGYGAGGVEVQRKKAIGETWVENEYVAIPKPITFIKGAVMHDGERIDNIASRGPGRTWAIKRKIKRGFQAGPLIYIDKADGKPEAYTIETYELAKMGAKYWTRYKNIKEQLKDKKLSKVKRKELNNSLNGILDKVKANFQIDLLDDDEHRGTCNTKGRPIEGDTIRTTFTNAFDSIGYPSHVKLTEMTHGQLAFGQFDTKAQGKAKVLPEKQDDLLYLNKALKEGDITKDEYNIMIFFYNKEQESLRVKWRQSDQDELHIRGTKPILEDMMYHNTIVLMGDGNHNPGETGRLSKYYPLEFRESGLLKVITNPGEGNTYSQVWLNEKLKLDFYHKTFDRSTEISDVWKQIHGTRTDSTVIYTADRHQGGWAVKGWKIVYLDYGHQPDNSYVHRIGKCASMRGSVVTLLSKDGRFYSGVKFIDDISNDPIMAWETESKLLRKMHKCIEKYRKPEAKKKIVIMAEAKKKMNAINDY